MKRIFRTLTMVMLGILVMSLLLFGVVEPWIIEVALLEPVREIQIKYIEKELSSAAQQTQELIDLLEAIQTIKERLGLPTTKETKMLEDYLSNLYDMKSVFQGKGGDIDYYFSFAINGDIGTLVIDGTWYVASTLAVVILAVVFMLLGYSEYCPPEKKESSTPTN